MIVDIISNDRVLVYGATNEESFENAKIFMRLLGNDRWLSFSGMRYGPVGDNSRKFFREVKFKEAP